jgi:hypothetical protein
MRKLSILLILIMVVTFSITLFADDKEEKVTINPYGYIKLDALYETGRSSHGNFAIWAADPADNEGNFYVTAKETRLGFAIKGFGFGKFKATGKIEVDFHSSNSENKAYNYMRHAFMKISDGSLTIIAGQTWDIINPLNAATLNYPVSWGAGNIGYRRPQLSIRKDFKTGKNMFTMQAGIFRTIAADYDADGSEDGAAAGFPMIQGRIAGKFALGNGYLQLGVSGHYGKSKGDIEYTTSSSNADLLLVFSPKFKIVAEFFSGQNMGVFLGAIAQSVNTATMQEIKTKGFFVNAVATPTKKLRLSLGYGMDDPDDETLNAGNRSKNTTIFGNVLFFLSKSVRVGFEVANWTTDYLGSEQQKTTRIQNSWILAF